MCIWELRTSENMLARSLNFCDSILRLQVEDYFSYLSNNLPARSPVNVSLFRSWASLSLPSKPSFYIAGWRPTCEFIADDVEEYGAIYGNHSAFCFEAFSAFSALSFWSIKGEATYSKNNTNPRIGPSVRRACLPRLIGSCCIFIATARCRCCLRGKIDGPTENALAHSSIIAQAIIASMPLLISSASGLGWVSFAGSFVCLFAAEKKKGEGQREETKMSH